VATRGSVLYFVIVEMSVVNVMYQTSLRQFLQVFDQSMTRSAKSPVTAKRIQNIVECLTLSAFAYTARGLYEKDKFLFSILMTLKIQLQAKAVGPDEFQCFIKGPELVFMSSPPDNVGEGIVFRMSRCPFVRPFVGSDSVLLPRYLMNG